MDGCKNDGWMDEGCVHNRVVIEMIDKEFLGHCVSFLGLLYACPKLGSLRQQNV